MAPRPTPRFSQPAPVSLTHRASQVRFRSQRLSVSERRQSILSGRNMDNNEKVDSAEYPKSSTNLVRVKREGETRVSSEEEVLAHTTTTTSTSSGSLGHSEPTIAVINSSKPDKGEDSDGEDKSENKSEAGTDEDDPDASDGDESTLHDVPEGGKHHKPPSRHDEGDADTKGDREEESSSNDSAGQIRAEGPPGQTAKTPSPSKQQLNPLKAISPEWLLQSSEDEGDDGKFAPHLLFSQNRKNLTASQVQRQLATELSVRYDEDEDDQTTVKEQPRDSPIVFPDPLPTSSVPKGVASPEVDCIIVDSSPETETPKKGPLKRPAETTAPTTPAQAKRTRRVSQKPGPRDSLSASNPVSPITPRRQRENRGEVPIHEFKRDEDLWYLDGSVVIQIGDRAFRLHESLLSEKFTYFNALFKSDPRPARMIDNTPAYEVEGNADDFMRLHRYMQDPWDADESFHGLAPVARAAYLYGMQGALRHAAKRLNEIYPQEYVGSRGHSFAAEAITLAGDCPPLAFMVKPAMYDLLCQPEFRFPPSAISSDINDVFSVPPSRILQLLTARNELQGQWRAICSPESCLGDFDAEPTNKCRCPELFPDEALHPQLSEAEVKERKALRRERMLAVWFGQLYRPPTQPVSKEPQNTCVAKPKKRQGNQSLARPTKKRPEQTQKTSAPKLIIATGNIDIILGLELLSEEAWDDLECKFCIGKRRRKWNRKQVQIWKMLNGLFSLDDDDRDDDCDDF